MNLAYTAPERFKLFNRYWTAPAALCLVVEALLLYASFWVAYLLRFGPVGYYPYTGWDFRVRALTFASVILAGLYLSSLYDFKNPIRARQQFIRVLRSFAFSIPVLAAVYYLVPGLWLGRGVFALSTAIALALLIASRMLLCFELESRVFSERVLIVGCDTAAVELAREVLDRRHLGYEVVGFIADDPALQGVSLINPSVVGTTQEISRIAAEKSANRVVVAQIDQRRRLNLDGLLECETAGIPVERSSDYYEQLTGKVLLDGPRVKSWLLFSGGLTVSRPVLAAKRLLDILVSSVGLVVVSPMLLLAMGAIAIDSRGPVFYRQQRVGRHGRPFRMIKLRSMIDRAESATGPRWAGRSDHRITRVGRFLRRCHIDELPQLWNVLVGDMSLVGPRPERPEFVEQLIRCCPLYEKRLSVRPGITGWAQIMAPYAASVEDSKEKLTFDLYYIKNLSFFLDISILASTVRTSVLGRGSR